MFPGQNADDFGRTSNHESYPLYSHLILALVPLIYKQGQHLCHITYDSFFYAEEITKMLTQNIFKWFKRQTVDCQ